MEQEDADTTLYTTVRVLRPPTVWDRSFIVESGPKRLKIPELQFFRDNCCMSREESSSVLQFIKEGHDGKVSYSLAISPTTGGIMDSGFFLLVRKFSHRKPTAYKSMLDESTWNYLDSIRDQIGDQAQPLLITFELSRLRTIASFWRFSRTWDLLILSSQ